MVCSFDESVRFDIETKASYFAIALTLNQAGRPLAFFYLTHQGPGRCHLSIEKETSNNRDRSSLKALSNGWTFLTQDGGKKKKRLNHAMENGFLML